MTIMVDIAVPCSGSTEREIAKSVLGGRGREDLRINRTSKLGCKATTKELSKQRRFGEKKSQELLIAQASFFFSSVK